MKITHHALQYLLTQGYSLFPIDPISRKPLGSWKEYQERLPTEDEVEKWWGDSESGGVGIVTGEVSGITVVDIDVKNHEDHCTPDDFPPTYTIKTRSGGWHLYYNYYPDIKNSADSWEDLPGVDIRNNGGFVVAPPTEGYTILNNLPLVDFPKEKFITKKKGSSKKFSISERIGVSAGGRNNSIASIIGSLLVGVPEEKWATDVWPSVLRINQTYVPPLPESEVKNTFESIASKEKDSRERSKAAMLGSVSSPVQFEDDEVVEMKLRSTKNGGVIKDKLNALIALSNHPEWRDSFKYDEFKKVVMYQGLPMREHHILKTQTWLQGEMGLAGISKNIVADAIEERAHVMSFDSAINWLKSLEWDGVPRIETWLHKTYGVEEIIGEDGNPYYAGIGSNWLRAIVKRIVYPGSKFDHVLVIQGGQGVGKSTSFEILGQDWHVETIIKADDKDFIMQFDGKAIVEFSEGGTLSHSDTKILKSIITRTNDKYRAPYEKTPEEHPRRCVFCMTTNEGQYLKDETGNRRWWILHMPDGVQVDFDWLKDNRNQLFAEAYARVEEDWLVVPKDVSDRMQEESRIIDDIEDKVLDWFTKLPVDVRNGGVTPRLFFEHLYVGDEDKMPKTIPWNIEIKIKSAFVSALNLKYTQRRNDGLRPRNWFPTDKTPAPDSSKGVDF